MGESFLVGPGGLFTDSTVVGSLWPIGTHGPMFKSMS